MSALGDHRAALVARLTPGAPVAVSANPAAGPPVILVDLISLTEASGIGAWNGTVPIKCIVPPPGDAAAAALLEDMVDHVLATLGFGVVEPRTYRPNETTQVPMYEITYPAMVPNPNC